jgi:flagellar biosynthetic protein FliP
VSLSTTGLLLAQAGGAAVDGSMSLNISGGGSSAMKLFVLMTLLSFAASIVISLTSFTRIVIVLGFLRQALGTPQVPPNQVLLALALALTGFVMAPVGGRVWKESLEPYTNDKIGYQEAFDRASVPVLEFLVKHTDEKDLRLFFEISGRPRPAKGDAIPLTVAVPAFMTSELTTSFRMGLYIYLPLMLVDMLVGSILMSLGMMMMPPQMVALPVKLGIFLLADGWRIVIGGLVRSFG